ncbi:MAG: BamA/TamA family outer membrane protein [Bacteroidota bacterium]
MIVLLHFSQEHAPVRGLEPNIPSSIVLSWMSIMRRQLVPSFFLLLGLMLCTAAPASAQYFRFGKNKVQYDDLKWSYLQSKHFDIYYYEGAQHLADFTAKAAEDAYLQAERLFDHRISKRIPIIVYQSHNDFAVTNAVNLPVFSEGIAGVTEPFKNRIAIPFVGDYRQYRQTLHHELIHAVINDIYYGGTLQSVLQNNIALRIPHWFNEGLAEFASEGWSSDADDWLRDAIIHDDVPAIPYISGFASYQAGQGVWDYVAEQYGQEKIGEILQRLRITHSVEASFKRSTGLSLEEISERWQKTLKEIYYPELGARENITYFSRKIVTEKNGGFYNTSPALSPLGDRMAFVSSNNGLFDVLIVDTNEGKLVKKLVDGQTSVEYESLRILTPGLSWSPDGTQIALAVKSGPSDAIAVVDVDSEASTHYRIPDVDQIISVAWSPDGSRIAFEAAMDMQSDLFVLDLESHETVNYTNDVFSDHEPSWSPDGKSIVFHSDRGSYTALGAYQAATFNMVEHDYGQHDVYLLSLDQSTEARRLTYNTVWDDQSARFGSDPDKLLFLSDRNGIFNLYEKSLTSGLVRPLTNSLSGIKQVNLSADGGEAALVSMEQGKTLIYLMNAPFSREIDTDELPPNVWAQRVMQETILPAPAITLAPRSLQRDNPFLRDATDGIAYVRQPDAGGALMADRLMLLANRSPLSTTPLSDLPDSELPEEELMIARSSWDSTRYGSVNVNFDDYVFTDRPEDVTDDLLILRDPFDIEDNIDESGRFKPKRYKLRFSPDLVYGAAGYDALFGVQGITQITFSDMLGDHQVLVASNLLIDLRNSDYMMSYAYLPNRLDWSTSAFHVSRLLPDNNRNTIYRYRQYGLRYNVSYPLDKFRRIDANLSVIGVSQADIIEPSDPAITRTLLYPSVTFTRDVTTPGFMYPVSGSRYALSIAGSPFSFSEGQVRFVTLLGDVRRYIDLGRGRYTLALRASGATSLGPTQQLFYTAGVQNWVNREFDEDNGFPIEDISDFILATPIVPLRGYHINARSGTNFGLLNAELRFPLVAALLPGPIPLLPFYNVEGSAFVDVGAVWGGRGLDNPLNFLRTDEEGDRVFDDMVASMGFGVRTILLGYPVRLDFAWPHNGQRFGKQRTYISFGFDF